MIERYQSKEIASIFSEAQKFSSWLKVEEAVLEVLAKEKILPVPEIESLLKKIKHIHFTPLAIRKISKIEEDLKHDVLAFTTFCAEEIGKKSRFFHFGLTSTDVVDTALSMRIQAAFGIILEGVDALLKTLRSRALEFKNLPTIGRTHGMAAEPTIFGLKFLSYYSELNRHRDDLFFLQEELRVGKISGAVGVSTHFSPRLESEMLKKCGLKREWVSTQVLPRDHLAKLFFQFALIGSCIERIALEIRHLSRSEVGEVSEGFSKKQKGSSAMPHKRNPISSENLMGISRVLRSYIHPSIENISLWHERDISHSSVERIILPDAFHLTHYALKRMNQVLINLDIHTDRIRKNLSDKGSLVFSGHLLLELVHKGANREEAYRWIQSASFRAMEQSKEARTEWEVHPEILKFLTPQKIRECVSIEKATRHVSQIYDAVLKSSL